MWLYYIQAYFGAFEAEGQLGKKCNKKKLVLGLSQGGHRI